MNNTNKWSQIGAWQGGSVSSVVLSPNFQNDGIAIAATSAGLFRTESFGQSWSLSMNGFSDPSALALASGQGNDGTILIASSEQGRLFRSSDLGASWSEIVTWAGLGIGSAIAISPDFASDKTFFVATSEGIFRTLDDGVTWQEASFGLLDLDVICLALAPDFAQSQTLWVGTALGGLFRSRNAGRAWRESGEGLPDCAVQTITLSPDFAADQTLFVGMEEGGVYRSQDGGRSWSLAGEALAEIGVNALATTPNDEAAIGYRLLAGTSVGIYSSADSGETWRLELADLPVLDLSLHGGGSGMAAVYQQGIFSHSQANGEWQSAATGIIAHSPPQVVQCEKGILLALDNDGEMALGQNRGADWQPLQTPDPYSPIVAIDATAVAGETSFYAASLTALYCTSSDSIEWHALLEPPLLEDDSILQLVALGNDPQLQIALGTAQGDVLWLDDADRQWQRLEQPWQRAELLSIFFASAEPMLHALSAAENANQNYDIELWRFDGEFEGGWSSLATLESESPAVLTLSTDDSIFLATQNRLIKLFTNLESDEFEVAQHFFAEDTRITVLAKSSIVGDLYLATTTAIHRSSDDGISWEAISELPTSLPIVSILPDLKNGALTVVCLGGEVWSSIL